MTPKQISEIKKTFIEQRQEFIRSKVSSLQKKLYDVVFEKVISLLETKDGNLVSNTSNIRMVADLDAIFKNFSSSSFQPIVLLMGKDLIKITNINQDYFAAASDKHLDEVKKVSVIAKEKASKRLGITKDGKIQNKSFIDKLIKDESLKKHTKAQILKAITNGRPVAEITESLKKNILGSPKTNGALVRYFDQFMRDTYTQFDRSNSKDFAVGLKMNAFRYQGGKIKTTRCFCLDKDGKIFTIQEAEKWSAQLNKSCGPIWNEKVDGKYIPVTMMGGYGCLHAPDFVSDSLAVRLRPDLKGSL